MTTWDAISNNGVSYSAMQRNVTRSSYSANPCTMATVSPNLWWCSDNLSNRPSTLVEQCPIDTGPILEHASFADFFGWSHKLILFTHVAVVPKAKRPCAMPPTLQNAAIDHFNLMFVCRRYREAGIDAATENIALGGANVFVRNTQICRTNSYLGQNRLSFMVVFFRLGFSPMSWWSNKHKRRLVPKFAPHLNSHVTIS